MPLYIDPEVLIANLLDTKGFTEGVGYTDIEIFVMVLECELERNVWSELNSEALYKISSKYHREFREFGGRFFINEKLNLHIFNSRFTSEESEIFVKTAKKFSENRKEKVIDLMKKVKREIDFFGNLKDGTDTIFASNYGDDLKYWIAEWQKLKKYNKDQNLGITEEDVKDYYR